MTGRWNTRHGIYLWHEPEERQASSRAECPQESSHNSTSALSQVHWRNWGALNAKRDIEILISQIQFISDRNANHYRDRTCTTPFGQATRELKSKLSVLGPLQDRDCNEISKQGLSNGSREFAHWLHLYNAFRRMEAGWVWDPWITEGGAKCVCKLRQQSSKPGTIFITWCVITFCSGQICLHTWSTEVIRGQARTVTPSAVDGYAFGCLIHEVFNGAFSRAEDLGQRGSIPTVSCVLNQKKYGCNSHKNI